MLTLHKLPLFLDATDDELQWLLDNSHETSLQPGDYFWREGDHVRHFYVVLEGELQITQARAEEQIVLGTTPPGVMGGEIFLLSGTRADFTAQAIVPSRLMIFELPAFLGIFTHCPSVGLKILRTAAERLQILATQTTQQEKMAALGKLSAGLAHELNNPAAATQRAASSLRTLLPHFQASTIWLNSIGLSEAQLTELAEFASSAEARMLDNPPLSTLEQSDREEEAGEWLESQAIENGWDMVANFVAARLTIDELQTLLDPVEPACRTRVLAWLNESLAVSSLLDEITQGTRRISDLVGAIKSYTYMDQGTWHEVDLHRDLENTLLVLKHKLKNIRVVREYDPMLPKIWGRGGELNQVWTNLIDNAIDAQAGNGTIWLITRCELNVVMVEVRDAGPGIPADQLPHLFEPFFTTKAIGTGTGLGLEICYRVVQQHGGTIVAESTPGSTRFIVRLPIQQEKPR